MKEVADENASDRNYGLDDEGVTECFQYHDTKVSEYEVKFNFYDKFYRVTCQPMYLMKIKTFNEFIDEMVKK